MDDLSWIFEGFGKTNPDLAERQLLKVQAVVTAKTDTRPRAGTGSATTSDVSNSASTHGNKGQDMALGDAGRCVHDANRNRVDVNRLPGL
jgi:hypothetical protein